MMPMIAVVPLPERVYTQFQGLCRWFRKERWEVPSTSNEVLPGPMPVVVICSIDPAMAEASEVFLTFYL
jgi:hypothetical protein